MPELNAEGVPIFYTIKGEGTPVVFIHPPLITSEIFKYQIEALSHHFQVIVFDIRGHGRSGYSHRAITYSLIVSDIIHLLDELGIDKAFIGGYSTGGSIGLEFLLTHPDRALGAIVISGMPEVSDWYLKQRIALAVGLSNPRTLPLLSLSISWGNADNRETFQRLHHEALMGNVVNIKQYFRYSLRYNCTSRLPDIKHPVLLVYGSKDEPFHRYAKLLHENLPCNELRFLKKVTHQLPAKAAFPLNELIGQFMQKCETGN